MSARVRAIVWALGWALVAWGLLGPFTRELEANADTERDVLRALSLIDHGVVPTAGPAIDYLPIALPPTWYYVVAPVVFTWRSLDAIHGLHVLVLMLGVAAIAAWRSTGSPVDASSSATQNQGRPALLAAGLLLGTTYVPEVLASVWHNGLVPGVSALWVAALLRWDSPSPNKAGWALAAAFSCAALLVQVHVVSVLTLLAPSLLLGVSLCRDGLRRTWRSHLVTAAVLGLLAATVVALLWDLDLQLASKVMAARTATPVSTWDALVAATLRLSELLTPNIIKDLAPVGGLWLLVAAVGAISGDAAKALRAALSVSFVAGLASAAMLSGLDPAPRYFGPALWSVVGLAALGARALTVRLSDRLHTPWPNARPALWLPALWLLFAGLAFWPLGRPAAEEVLRETAIPSAPEQSTLAAVLRDDLGATLDDLDRLHGPVMNGLSAMRLHAVLARWPRTAPDRGDPETLLYAGPADFPTPSSLSEKRRLPAGSDRDWIVGRMAASSRLLGAHVAERRCTLGWPYRWSALEAAELRPFGLRAGASVEACRSRQPGSEDAPLVLDLEILAPRTTLILGWFDVVRHRPERARVSLVSGGARLTRLEGPLWRDLAGWTVEVQSTPARVRLSIAPVETLSTVELY
ncbi:MAG: hypothetical protein IV100_03450 [Myxococcales bacterium]|nr:hypothetical protein [Myxococcales bacterium]